MDELFEFSHCIECKFTTTLRSDLDGVAGYHFLVFFSSYLSVGQMIDPILLLAFSFQVKFPRVVPTSMYTSPRKPDMICSHNSYPR